jgi:predicted unusual protein kinase regulating ubiquinone biosynthesis (AarF/ABC1/UbiB family)
LATEPLSLDEVATTIEADFGAAARELLHTMRSTPIAVGDAAQVHRATLSDGTPVAVKVRRSAAASDFSLAAQRHERYWWLFAGHRSVVVPALKRAWCSARVVTSDFVSGATLEEWLATRPNDEARNRAGEALFDFYVGMAFEHGLYFAEVDPGNQLFLPDGRVAFVSFGGVREAAPGCMARLAGLTHTVWGGGGDELVRALYGPMLLDEVAAFAPPSPELVARGQAVELRETARVVHGLMTLMAQVGARANFRRRLDALLSAYPQPAFDVVLVDPGDSAITMARALLDATGLPLREIEVIIKKSPQTIKQAVPRAEAEALRVRLEQAGARVEIKLV